MFATYTSQLDVAESFNNAAADSVSFNNGAARAPAPLRLFDGEQMLCSHLRARSVVVASSNFCLVRTNEAGEREPTDYTATREAPHCTYDASLVSGATTLLLTLTLTLTLNPDPHPHPRPHPHPNPNPNPNPDQVSGATAASAAAAHKAAVLLLDAGRPAPMGKAAAMAAAAASLAGATRARRVALANPCPADAAHDAMRNGTVRSRAVQQHVNPPAWLVKSRKAWERSNTTWNWSAPRANWSAAHPQGLAQGMAEAAAAAAGHHPKAYSPRKDAAWAAAHPKRIDEAEAWAQSHPKLAEVS